jgi:hypothetical protein
VKYISNKTCTSIVRKNWSTKNICIVTSLARLKKFDLKPYLVEGYEFSEEETSEVDFEDGNENCDSICSSQSGDDHDLEFFSENF